MNSVVVPVKSLDARYYTDPDVFRLEADGLFKRIFRCAVNARHDKVHIEPNQRDIPCTGDNL